MVTIENYPYDINDSEEIKLAWVSFENLRLDEELNEQKAIAERQAKIDSLDSRILAQFQDDGGLPWRVGILDDSNPLKAFRDLIQSDPDQAIIVIEALEQAKLAFDADRLAKSILKAKLAEIASLEASITPRRLREAMISGDMSFINSIEAQIALLRSNI